MTEDYYVIDTSSLIDLNKFNPIDIYPSVWKKIEVLIDQGQLFSPIEVFNELVKQDDKVAEWAKQHKKMFKPITPKQTEIVAQILKKYPSIINIKKEFSADPWVIALAVEFSRNKQQTLTPLKWLVVTEESQRENKIRIPLICKDFNIGYLKIFDMFRKKGWKF